MKKPTHRFIDVFHFTTDNSKPGRALSWVRIGDVYMSRLIISPGVATGNYYHKKTRVMFYVGRGEVVAAFEQVKTGEKKKMKVRPGKHVIHMPAYVAHCTKNVGTKPAVLVFFSNRKLRSGDDYGHKVLD